MISHCGGVERGGVPERLECEEGIHVSHAQELTVCGAYQDSCDPRSQAVRYITISGGVAFVLHKYSRTPSELTPGVVIGGETRGCLIEPPPLAAGGPDVQWTG